MIRKIKQNHPKPGLEAAFTFLSADKAVLRAGRGKKPYSEEIRGKKYV